LRPNPNSKARLINEPQDRRQHAVASKDHLEIPAHLVMTARTAAQELTVPQAILVLMLHLVPLFCHHLTSALAPLHLATAVQKVNLDHPVKEDHLVRPAPMPFSHHPVLQDHLDQPVPMAKLDLKVPQETLANKRQVSLVPKVHPDPQGPLVNQAQEANPATMENQDLKDPQDLKVIAAQVAIPVTQAVPENLVMSVTKVCRALVLNAHRLGWLQAINRQAVIALWSYSKH